jgi:phosphoribosylamine---glycine ligase
MKVLLIGSGGRESAIAASIKKSPILKELKVYPGNGGFSENELVPLSEINLKDKNSVQNYVRSNLIDFVIVGPEEPLVDGIIDWLDEIQIPAFGPSKHCAQLEGSKNFAKILMHEFGVPTANSATFQDYTSALSYIEKVKVPIVIKADGLAAGKGVTVCLEMDSGRNALRDIFLDHKFGESGSKVVIEEFMEGEEASIFAFCDGQDFIMLPAAQDHKRAFDGDNGPNTGGMGAYAPAPIATESIRYKVKEKIFRPMIDGLKKQGTPFKGLLYAGLMIGTDEEPRVVEFNVRFGDPETQALLLLLEDDLLEILLECAKGKLSRNSLKIKDAYSSVVVLAAKGYPDSYEKNIHIDLKSTNPSIEIYHAGTINKDGKILSSGGRILGIASVSSNLKNSLDLIYDFLNPINIPNTFYRKDIGMKAL